MAFGLSGSKSKSTSEAYGYSGSQSLSESQQLSAAQSMSQGQMTSSQGLAFEDLFAQLYGGAASTAAGISGQPIANAAQQLFSGGMGFLDQLQDGGAGGDYLSQRMSGQSPVLDEQIGALGEDLGRFFREDLNPAISGQAVGGMGLGGGRQGVAQGRAMETVGREFQRGATGLRAADMASRDQAAQGLMAGQTQAAGTGLASLGGLLGIQEAGTFADLSPYAALQSILGGPTVLTQAQSTDMSASESISEAVARAISESFGEDFAKSKSTSKSAGFGMGSG